MKHKHFIPVQDINKLPAFCPSLDKNYRDNQRIKSQPIQIETLDVVRRLGEQGWQPVGVNSIRDKRTFRADKHVILMNNPSFNITGTTNSVRRVDGHSTMQVSNSCSGSSPLSIDLGFTRAVCSNGCISRETEWSSNIQHNAEGMYAIDNVIYQLNDHFSDYAKSLNNLQTIEVDEDITQQLAYEASKLRTDYAANIDPNMLLQIRRDVDRGNTLYNVYNVIQENLTKPNMVIDKNGRLITRSLGIVEDRKINQKLTELVMAI